MGVFMVNFSALSLGNISHKEESLHEMLKEVSIQQDTKTHASSKKDFPEISTAEAPPIPISPFFKKEEIPQIASPEISRTHNFQKKDRKQDAEQEIKKEKKEICAIPAKIPEEIQKEFSAATKDIPCHLLSSLRKVEIFDDPDHIFPRAMANGRILKIRRDAIEEPEFIQVLIHELGHVVDLGGLKSQKFLEKSAYKDGKKIIYADDKSVIFYQISWANEYEQVSQSSDLDFIGGYASLDMFEDYAESFLMYIEHGNDFRMLATDNEKLQKKYNFFRDQVFDGKEFFTGDFQVNFAEREWDITKYQ